MPSENSRVDTLLLEKRLRELQAEKARRSFFDFVTFTKRGYHQSEFARNVCEALDDFLKGVFAERNPVLLLQAPPQHGKSELVSRRFPAYVFGRYPDMRFAACSYSADLARDMNRDVQSIMQCEAYKRIFPETWLNPKRVVTVENQALRNSERFDILGHDGYYICTGVGGPLTGKSVDIGVIDDPIKNEQEARSPKRKYTIRKWYDTVFSTRLSRRSGQIIMATSWAIDDLIGTISKEDPDALHLRFPAINAAGEALVPELHPIRKLRKMETTLGPTAWAALYMQNPVMDGGNIFKEHWFQYWLPADLPKRWDEVIQSWDFAFKGLTDSDFVVGQVWGRVGSRFYLLHQIRERMGFVDSLQAMLRVSELYPQAYAKLIEDKANGPAIIDTLKNKIPGLIPVEPDGSKVARAHATSALWMAGNVLIPANAPWRPDYVSELVQFPAGGNDDQVDGSTQALRYLARHGHSLNIWEILGQ